MSYFVKTDHIKQTMGVWEYGNGPSLPTYNYFVRKNSYDKNKQPHLGCLGLVFFFLFQFETWQTTLLYGGFEMQLSLLAALLHLPRMHLLSPAYSRIIFFTQQKEAFIGKPSNSRAVCDSRRKSVVSACNGKPGCVFSVFFLLASWWQGN